MFSVQRLAAAAAALAEDIPLPQIKQKSEKIPGVEGRFEAVDAGQDFLVLVDYAQRRQESPGDAVRRWGLRGGEDHHRVRLRRLLLQQTAADGVDRRKRQ